MIALAVVVAEAVAVATLFKDPAQVIFTKAIDNAKCYLSMGGLLNVKFYFYFLKSLLILA